jgi:predicted RNA methylase
MAQLRNLSKAENPSIAIKQYLAALGYQVSVTKSKKPFQNFPALFFIQIIDGQKFPEELVTKIHQNLPNLVAKNSSQLLSLPLDACQLYLPMLQGTAEPSSKSAKQTTARNTPEKEPKTKTEKDSGNLRAKGQPGGKAVQAEIRALLDRPDFDTMVLTESEWELLEKYEGVGADYDESKGYEHNEAALTQFYTPDYLATYMYQVATYYGYSGEGHVLEPSCGVGRLIKPVANKKLVTGFEVDPVVYRIAKKLYPEATLYNDYFETAFLQPPRFTQKYKQGVGAFARPTWLTGYPFELVIGNPPYGRHKNQYSSYMPVKFAQIEMAFVHWGGMLLKKGGLLIYLTAQNFLRTGSSQQYAKETILENLQLIDAFRLPGGVFANSQVGTDILVFRKK